jgi:hypothetical protein
VIFTIPNYLHLDHVWLWRFVPGKMAAIMHYGAHTRALFIFASPKLDYDYRNIEQQKTLVR